MIHTRLHRGYAYVVSIKSNAFTNCSGLTSISIPATVTVVDYGSFNGCKGLKNVTLEDGNAPLLLQCHYENRTLGYGQTGSGLFHSCSIENLYIGRNIVEDSIRGNKWIYRFPYEYGYSPFYDNASITRVTIGNKVTELPAYLFYGISGISTMELPHVKKIGAHCFDGAAKMTTLSLGDALTHVGDYAFKGCSNLTNLAFPTTTKLLGEGAFYDCNSITSTSFANGCQLDSIDSLCFYNCYALTAFKCPKTVSYIGNSAFENCKKLVTIVLGEKMTAINKATFKGDVALSEMTVNEGVTSIYDEAFYNCEGIAVYSLPQSLITIGDEVFYNNGGLPNLTIPGNVKKMGQNCFYGCTRLTYLTFSDGVGTLDIDNNNTLSALYERQIIHDYYDHTHYLNDVSYNYFYDCPLRRIYIGRDLNYWSGPIWVHDKDIYSSPFASKTTLRIVKFGNKVTYLGKYFIAECNNVATIECPESLDSICNNAFEDCTGLTKLTYNNGLGFIGAEVMLNCNKLETLAFPGSLYWLGNKSLNGCTSLKEISFNDGQKELKIDNDDKAALTVDCPLQKLYIGKNITYKDVEVDRYGYTCYYYSPFQNKSSLTDVTFSQSGTVTYLESKLLLGCNSVQSLRLPESLRRIGNSTMQKCQC